MTLPRAAFDKQKLELPVTRAELYLVARQLENMILAARYEVAATRIGGPSIDDAVASFQNAENELENLLSEFVRQDRTS